MPSYNRFSRRAGWLACLACLLWLLLSLGAAIRPSGWPARAAQLAPPAQPYPRSFEVYATQYDAGERKIVALPDKCLKFANGSAQKCPGYEYGQDYSVAISYKGKMVVALVGEAGPWNIDDNYWARPSDSQPRRMFADLPLGVPAAQAAFYNGYHGGLDQFGRLVTSPVGIDISTALAADLGLPAGNVKVTVSFLWTAGWDDAQAAPPSSPPGQAATPAEVVAAWQTAAPQQDGSQVHIVQPGQTLVGIANVYGVLLADLLALNGLDLQSVIQPGQRILVRPVQVSTQSAASPAGSATASKVTPTGITLLTATAGQTPTAVQLPTVPDATAGADATTPSNFSPRLTVLLVIILLVALGVVLLIWGLAVSRRE